MRSVIATDTVHFSLAMLGTLIYAIVVIVKSGGVGQIVDRLVELYGTAQASQILSFSTNTWETLMPFLVIVSL